MADYRLYFLDDGGHIHGVVEFVAEDDARAAEHATRHADGRGMELWRRDHLLRTFERTAAPA